MSAAMLLASVLAGCPQQAEVLERAAAAIQENYYPERQAGLIAESVREWAQRGRYADACGDWHAFAERMNTDLDAYNGHFYFERVEKETTAKSEPDWLMAWRAEAVPSNAGVREVRVFEGNIGYIRLSTFYSWDMAKDKLRHAMALVGDTTGLILDLRQNGGGDAETAGHLVRAFLGDDVKTVQRIESRRGAKDEALPERDIATYGRKLVVLVDRRSASASEFLAYSLQSAGRATVIGSRSAGAASLLDEPQPLVHGFQISVPNAWPVNLKTGKNWEGEGVTPDVKGGDDPVYVARRLLGGESAAAR